MKAENAFLVQQHRIKTLARMRKQIRLKANEASMNQATVDLSMRAKTIKDGEITNEKFVNFLQEVRTALLSRLGNSKDPELLASIGKRDIPIWNNQFNTMFEKALKEGNISIDRLEYFRDEYLRITSAINTEANLRSTRILPGQTLPLTEYEEKLEARKVITQPTRVFPRGTQGRAQAEVTLNNQPQMLSNLEVRNSQLSIRQLNAYITELRIPLNYYEEQNDQARAKHIAYFLADIVRYRRKLEANEEPDYVLEEHIETEVRRILDEYASLGQQSSELLNIYTRHYREINDIATEYNRMKENYNYALQQSPDQSLVSSLKKTNQRINGLFTKITVLEEVIEDKINGSLTSLEKAINDVKAGHDIAFYNLNYDEPTYQKLIKSLHKDLENYKHLNDEYVNEVNRLARKQNIINESEAYEDALEKIKSNYETGKENIKDTHGNLQELHTKLFNDPNLTDKQKADVGRKIQALDKSLPSYFTFGEGRRRKKAAPVKMNTKKGKYHVIRF